ncbi:hypothetical protein NE237_021697 [Protea cynaroides]|uniref:Uncharacterized protein n=1 Tax=Protea cynaroides TaxID=273540 RepID=A0A9Q0K3S5_9MAGN|nr:hypothetical protein NE237_021697 [Protea cynaroides]
MRRYAVGEGEQRQLRRPNGWQDKRTAGDYQAYVQCLLKAPSMADEPACPNGACSITTTQQRQVEWNTHTTDDYHTHVNRMLRMPSIVDAPPYPRVHTLFKNEGGHLN